MYTDIFNEYKEINLQIIKSIKDDKEDPNLFEKREEIIKKILSLDIEKSILRKTYEDMGLEELDKELEETLKEKMLSIKSSIKKLALSREANKGYTATNRRQNFFSTKI